VAVGFDRVHSHSHGCRRFTQGDIIDILYLLIPLSIVLVFLIGAVFWWSLRSGQFDDLDSAGTRLLLDDAPVVSRQHGRQR